MAATDAVFGWIVELAEHILGFVNDGQTLQAARQVCTLWNAILTRHLGREAHKPWPQLVVGPKASDPRSTVASFIAQMRFKPQGFILFCIPDTWAEDHMYTQTQAALAAITEQCPRAEIFTCAASAVMTTEGEVRLDARKEPREHTLVVTAVPLSPHLSVRSFLVDEPTEQLLAAYNATAGRTELDTLFRLPPGHTPKCVYVLNNDVYPSDFHTHVHDHLDLAEPPVVLGAIAAYFPGRPSPGRSGNSQACVGLVFGGDDSVICTATTTSGGSTFQGVSTPLPEGFEYRHALGASCIGRVAGPYADAKKMASTLGCSVSGFYGYGEIGRARPHKKHTAPQHMQMTLCAAAIATNPSA